MAALFGVPSMGSNWAQQVKKKRKSKEQIINLYEFDMSGAKKELKMKQFGAPDTEWLNFITACRSGNETGHNYDIVMGPVANDNVYATIQLYETGLLSEAETIIRLKVEKIHDQILFHTERALAYISFLRYENTESENE